MFYLTLGSHSVYVPVSFLPLTSPPTPLHLPGLEEQRVEEEFCDQTFGMIIWYSPEYEDPLSVMENPEALGLAITKPR